MGAVSAFMCRISLSQPSNTLKKEIEIGKERKEKNPETGTSWDPRREGGRKALKKKEREIDDRVEPNSIEEKRKTTACLTIYHDGSPNHLSESNDGRMTHVDRRSWSGTPECNDSVTAKTLLSTLTQTGRDTQVYEITTDPKPKHS